MRHTTYRLILVIVIQKNEDNDEFKSINVAACNPLKKVVNNDFYVLTNNENPTEPRTYRNYYNKLMTKLNIPKLKFHGLPQQNLLLIEYQRIKNNQECNC